MTTYVTKETLKSFLEGTSDPKVLTKAIGRACFGIDKLIEEGWSSNAELASEKTKNEIRLTGLSYRKKVRLHGDNAEFEDWQINKWTKVVASKGGVPRLCLFAAEINELARRKVEEPTRYPKL